MTLSKDITSSLRKDYLYAKKGDEVRIISEHGNTCCVEAKDGKKFAVNKEFLIASNKEDLNATIIEKG